MKLKDNLYRIVSADTSTNTFRIEFVPESCIYKAHFPEMPVTPGVCIVQIAGELLEEKTGVPMRLTTVSNAKFLAVISPQENPLVTYQLAKIACDEESGICKLSAIVSNNEKVFAKLSLVFSTK